MSKSAYQQAIAYLERAHMLIDGDHWRDQEIRSLLGRMIDLMEESRHAARQGPGAVVCLTAYKTRAERMPQYQLAQPQVSGATPDGV